MDSSAVTFQSAFFLQVQAYLAYGWADNIGYPERKTLSPDL